MLVFRMRWSRWEFGFVSSCHCAAVISTFRADLLMPVAIVIAALIAVSYQRYVSERLRTFTLGRLVALRPVKSELIIESQSARLSHCGEIRKLELPRILYLSEFLIVLSFRQEMGNGVGKPLRLALWPDSLARNEDRRLRRYLRFDLPTNLHER